MKNDFKDDTDRVWRLPVAIKGEDVRLAGNGLRRPLSQSVKARLYRIVHKAPEVMVKITGRTRGGGAHLKAHLDYITRNGQLRAETQDGVHITDRADLRSLHDDWLLANAADSRTSSRPNATQSVAVMLSMAPGTPPDRVEAAARTWARQTFNGHHDWLMVRHDDTDHPHVHIAVRAVGSDGRRLAPGPKDLQQWRERFARELRRLGIEAEATPRQARGTVQKTPGIALHKAQQRGVALRVHETEKQHAGRDAGAAEPPPPSNWSQAIQSRQESIRHAFLAHAQTLAQGDADDCQLARDIGRFVANMPVPLTRRQTMAVELRRVLGEHAARKLPAATVPDLAEVSRHNRLEAKLQAHTQAVPESSATMPEFRR